MPGLTRRSLLAASGAAAAAVLGPGARPTAARERGRAQESRRILFAVKYSMVEVEGASMLDNFRMLASIGFDGVELDSPNRFESSEVLEARDASGLPIHGVVDSIHWNKRLSHPDSAVRAEGIAGLETAIRDSKAYGGSSVLLVPGAVRDAETENQQQCWERSIEGIREVLPLAAKLGIYILIENVWNHFCYDHGGSDDQTADQLADYIDAIGSPWVGAYYDLGNHRRYGLVHEWVRTMGSRIVKLDVKDWGKEAGFCKLGDGDVDWAEVRAALAEIGFTGWATAEVRGGDAERMGEIKRRMDAVLRV